MPVGHAGPQTITAVTGISNAAGTLRVVPPGQAPY
jgi:hypothetical protein